MSVMFYTDYSQDSNRTIKIKMNGAVCGYSFARMQRWIDKWNVPCGAVRRSYRYRQLYLDHYRHIVSCTLQQARSYLRDGLKDCIYMFTAIRDLLPPEDVHYKSIVFEAKCQFFSYFDFCDYGAEKDTKIYRW